MRILIFLLLTGLAGPAAHAGPLNIHFAPPQQLPAAGTAMVFTIFFHNAGDQPRIVSLNHELECRLIIRDQVLEINAQRVGPQASGPLSIDAKGIVQAQFELQLPDDVQGTIQLVVPQFQGAGFHFAVQERPPDEESALSWLPHSTDEPWDAIISLYQPYAKNISFYEPMYFLVGTDPKYSKFQLSLKYRLFNPEKPIAKRRHWLTGFHFGYTQTSFWDLAADSEPFEDTSYRPEIFYMTDRLKTRIPELDGFFLKAGLRHESNGRGGEFSRSTYTAYLEPVFIFFNEHRRTGLKITPRIWTYFNNEDKNNPDLKRYRGYFNLGVTIGKADSLVLDSNFWWAAEGASMQVDATYPLHTFLFSDLDLYFQVQYTNQLAENLLNYTERTEAIRLGFAIVR